MSKYHFSEINCSPLQCFLLKGINSAFWEQLTFFPLFFFWVAETPLSFSVFFVLILVDGCPFTNRKTLQKSD